MRRRRRGSVRTCTCTPCLEAIEPRLLMTITPDRFEPNDTFDTPSDLGVVLDRTENDLNVHAAGNQDFYRFTAAESGNYSISILFLQSQGDLDLTLYSDANSFITNSTGTVDNEQVTAFLVAGSAYKINVAGYAGATNPHYDLVIDGPGTADPPPTVASSSFNYISSQQVQLVFSEDVLASVDAGDLQVTNKTTNTLLPASAFTLTKSNDSTSGATTARWTANSILADGNYEAVLPANAVQDSASQPMDTPAVVSFWFLGADGNRDRRVDLTDFTILASNFNKSGQTFDQGDFSYDGTVDLTDFTILASKFNKQLDPPPAAAPRPAAAASTVLATPVTADQIRDSAGAELLAST
jgi:hypothetical protein